MQVLTVNSARSTWLFDIDDLNPSGKSVLTELFSWAKERYRFAVAPSSLTDVTKEGNAYTFSNGQFKTKAGLTAIVELTVYNDGLMANSYSSTRDTEAFLEDLLTNASSDFKLRFSPSMVRKKVPLSELNVRIDQPLSMLNPELVPIAQEITSLSPAASSYEVGGISFWTDSSELALKLAPFTLERKANVPFSENRYYSKASLHTDQHIGVLKRIEQLLTLRP